MRGVAIALLRFEHFAASSNPTSWLQNLIWFSLVSIRMSNASDPTVVVTVKLFAAYQDAYGVPELTLALPLGATAGSLCDRLLQDHPELQQWRSLTRFGVNFQFVEPDWVLQDGDEVALIPPVSGG